MAKPGKTLSIARLLGACPLPLYLLDAQRTIVYANRACLDWLQLPPEAVLGRTADYHSQDSSPINFLCPPPTAFAGKHTCAVAVRPAPTLAGLAAGGPAETIAEAIPLFSPGDEPGSVLVVLRACDDALDIDRPAHDASDLHAALQRIRQARAVAAPQLAGVSALAEQLRAQVAVAADSAANVVIIGPRGAGKISVAHAIHAARSVNQRAPLVVVDAEVGTPELLDRAIEALGGNPRWQRPANRAASGDVPPAERQPHGMSTLLLARLDRISPELTAAVTSRLDVLAGAAVITTSRRPLADLEARGVISADLACRLATLEIRLPSLAARRDDLPLMVQYLVEALNAQRNVQMGGVTRELLARLAITDFPGELKQLERILAEGHRRAPGAEIALADVPLDQRLHDGRTAAPVGAEPFNLDAFLRQVEHEAIQRALKRARGNKAKAARLLGWSRPRLYRRMVQLQLIEAPEGWPLSVDEEPPEGPESRAP